MASSCKDRSVHAISSVWRYPATDVRLSWPCKTMLAPSSRSVQSVYELTMSAGSSYRCYAGNMSMFQIHEMRNIW